MKEKIKAITDEQLNDLYKRIFRGVKSKACNVCHEYCIISYHDFLPISTLKPVLERLFVGYKVVLLRNRSSKTYDRAILRAWSSCYKKEFALGY